ncbi:ABC transporter substrate-binding protein [Alkalicoccobacillus murimartini]|uniref:Sn-glycerol 3-phosphate transport system substrate-binding protein n=1 Tax=Alkalicoccobacillus murimartini TaxID=171685 RepID=A0ABT9YHZ3_9BACI|nr:ABC transporter substrate-binding protein [Alkalicoccobacillus murimartini]MDQ0207223.1 sn-glycerol 3-phosphate transport system substrate-binding protein [Alkalicoccobacillus murimartini]
MKTYWTLGSAMAAMLVITGCGSSGTTESVSGAQPDEPIELTYWYAWGDKIGENNENLVEQFNEAHPNIQVTAEFQGTYDELHAKTQAAFAAKDAPEVTQNEIASVETFAKNGMTESLQPFIDQDELDIEDFNEGLMGNSYVDDEIYALPYLRSTPILYLNTTLLEEKGLDPAGPKTWDEFKEYAAVLSEDGEMKGATMPIDIWFYEAFVTQAGGEMIDDAGKPAFNSEAGAEAIDFIKEMYEAGSIKVPTGDVAGDTAKQDFVNGKSGMMLSSTADLTYLMTNANDQGYEVDTAFMPENKQFGVPTGGANLVMTAGLDEAKQEAAWTFIKWMTDTEQTAYSSEFTGYLPSRHSASETEKIQKVYEEVPQYKTAVEQLEYAHERPMVEGYPEVVNALVEEITRAVLQDGSSQDALDNATERAEAVLK